MTASGRSTATATAGTPRTKKHRTLEELLDDEERLATRGVLVRAEALGHDALDALNLPRFVRRHPLAAAGVSAGTGFLIALARRSRGRRRPKAPGILRLLGRTVRMAIVEAALQGVGKMLQPARKRSSR